MNRKPDWNDRDPLALSNLPLEEPDFDGWPEIRAALQEAADRPAWQRHGRWLAAAAVIALALGLVLVRQAAQLPATVPAESVATLPVEAASDQQDESLDALIAMSQVLEQRVRSLRDDTGSMPADSATYVAELEDLVAQVDNELSYTPGSKDLWGQRVNLLLDLAQIYQHQWERVYGRMASL